MVKGSVNSFNINRLSFQTAERYGRYARGGRGGRIVEVTNLNDSGEGSLRQALEVEKRPRIVVFRVGGVITLKSMLCIPEDGGDVYVAGQTAPEDGITLTGYDFGAMGASDVVIRNVRVRVGDSNQKSTGGMGLASCNQSIIDHCSISWTTDEGFSSRSAQNITFQWNIIGESLHDSVHYDSRIPTLMPEAPIELFRYEHWRDPNWSYNSSYENRYDMQLTATLGMINMGGYGYYWGQQLSDEAVLGLADGNTSVHICKHQL